MTTLSKAKRNLAPQRIVTLSPICFEANWPGRPAVDVAIGLRLLSIAEISECRMEAEREAAGVYDEHPDGTHVMGDVIVEQYNEILLCEVMARATCNPNDITKPYFEKAVQTVRVALTSEALRKLWDEYTKLSKGSGVVMTPATDAELRLFGRAMLRPKFRESLDDEGRKLVAYLLEKLEAAIPEGEKVSDANDDEDDGDGFLDDDDDGESVYTATTGATAPDTR
jgi:hypothetical protein